jgi:hypothetical protein
MKGHGIEHFYVATGFSLSVKSMPLHGYSLHLRRTRDRQHSSMRQWMNLTACQDIKLMVQRRHDSLGFPLLLPQISIELVSQI